MKDWFDTLQPRERLIIIAGSIIVVLTLLYTLAWEPLQTGHQRAREDVARKSRLISDARRVLAPGATATTSGGNSSGQSLTLIIANTVNANNLARAYKSSSPTGENGLRVSLENASFDDLVVWLAALEGQHTIGVVSGSFSTRKETGRVDASVVVQPLR